MNKKIVAFGEIMLRLSPQNRLLIKDAPVFDANYGGSEANVLVALTALGNKTEYLSVIPENEVGRGAINALKKLGVDTERIVRAGDNLGLYFLEQGFGERPSKVIYMRKHAAVTEVDENAFDYDEIFNGCSIFHLCGITLALSEKCKNAALRLAKEAKKRGVLISFDFNYRSKLWTIEKAAPAYQAFLPYVDICVGNTFDLRNFLAIDKPTDEEIIDEFFRLYGAKYLCFNKRVVHSSTVNSLTGYIYEKKDGKLCSVSYGPVQFEILDRIGSGDCFTAGILHVLNKDITDVQTAVNYGIACDVLKHTLSGDVFTLTEKDATDFLNKKTKDVQR